MTVYDPIFSLRLATCMHFELLTFSIFYQGVEKFADQQDEKVESSEDSKDSEVNLIHC